MNIVFVSIITVGLGLMLLNSPETAFSTMLEGSTKAINLCIKLWAIYSVWLGLLKIVETTQLDKKIAKLLSPIINFLMGKTDIETKNQIAINITANMLGMGNACTPSGIKGMQGLDKGSKYITNAMVMFMILNTTGLELIPTTVIGLRISHGSTNPADIIIPTLIATFSSTFAGIVLVKLCGKIFKEKK